MTKNKVVRLARRPHGAVKREDFAISVEEMLEPGDGEFRVKTEYVSLDPAMRGWMNEGKSYIPPVAIGEVMRAITVGTVEASRHPDYAEGDIVVGLLGTQEYAISNGAGITKADITLAPMPSWLGGLGMPGLTAYFGLIKISQPREGETVVVSAASGAVGQIVGQIAHLKGCRAVGIAGGPEKCRFITQELGFDAAVDYKAGNLYGDLKAACPNGIDVNFESVGGDIMDTVLAQMNPFGRIALCGLISSYNATELPPGPKNMRAILAMRLRMQGFIVFDFIKDYPEALTALSNWYRDGKLQFREDVRTGGLDAFPDMLGLLYTGGNFGKLVLKI